jgi:hypothetical protein
VTYHDTFSENQTGVQSSAEIFNLQGRLNQIVFDVEHLICKGAFNLEFIETFSLV